MAMGVSKSGVGDDENYVNKEESSDAVYCGPWDGDPVVFTVVNRFTLTQHGGNNEQSVRAGTC